MDSNLLSWLQDWYEAQATDGWEHRYGVRLTTLDTPGWSISVDLHGTSAEGKVFDAVNLERGERDWVYCWVDQDRFEGRGGAHNLSEILEAFRTWAES